MFFLGGGGQARGPITFAPKTQASYRFGRLFTRHPVGAEKCRIKGHRPPKRGRCSRCGERVEVA